MAPFAKQLLGGLPQLDRQIWILIVGRLLSQLGTGFVLFYAPIFFVNQVGLSATAVGIGIGSESITGVIGRVLGGVLADSPRWGRRKTLLISAVISTIADIVLVFSYNFPTFLLGNLLMGLGVGLYWPSTESIVADLATPEQRNEAFALNRLADSLGLGLGVVLGGVWIATTGAYRALFAIDGLSFLIFFVITFGAIRETLKVSQAESAWQNGWIAAWRDRPLRIYVGVNMMFTTYLSLVNSTMPLYFNQFLPSQTASGQTVLGFVPVQLSALFTGYVAVAALCQLPIARSLRWFRPARALMFSASLWAIGFLLVWITGSVGGGQAEQLGWAALSLGTMAIAMVAYNPSASSLVVSLAPESMRGVYLSINSLCWAAGYFVGPTIGGWAMDQTKTTADRFWLLAAASVLLALAILGWLDRVLRRSSARRS